MRLFLITKVTFKDEKVIMVSDDTEEEVKADAKEYRIAGAQTRITNTRWLND